MHKDIKILDIEPMKSSNFLKPQSVSFIQDGRQKRWDFVKSHDSVSIILYHKLKESFLLVKQFRPAVFLNSEDNDGFTYELCAGIMDKGLDEILTVKEEVFEECGYELDIKDIKRVTSYYSSVGISGAKQTVFFAFIDESKKRNEGGGEEGEMIELFYLPKGKTKTFIFDETLPKSPGLIFGLMWFLQNETNL